MATDVWQPGEVILDLYEVLDVVHGGGMGVVHRVRHRGWNVDLAVKTPRPELVASAEGSRRFEAEAGTWVGLGLHPHTVNCAYVRTIDGIPRVFAEWVGGGNLAEAVAHRRLYQGGPQAALGRILDLAVQMAWGLEHAHHSGLIHQDVKPANVMLEADWTAKVTDFGLAGARADGGEDVEAAPDAPLTASYRGMTPAYCSPEQARAAAHRRSVLLTPATDVWSWALSVLEMFAGRRPAPYGQAAAEALEHLLDTGPADPRIPGIPPATAGLLRQCFLDDPAARPASLADAASALTRMYGEILGVPHPRVAPRAVDLRADGLSNQALSLLDLGRAEEADERWRQARGADPHHAATVYNHGLSRWRSGRLTDQELVSDLEAVRAAEGGGWPGDYLLGLVHLERCDYEQAETLLREAAREAPGPVERAEVASALAELERRPRHAFLELTGHRAKVTAVAVSADGAFALSGDEDGGLLLWDPRAGRLLRTLTRRGPEVIAVAVDAEGRTGLVARKPGAVEVWDLERDRSDLLTFDGDGPDPTAVAVGGDAHLGVVGYADGRIQAWDLRTREGIDFSAHTGPITGLGVSPDARFVLTAGRDRHDVPVRRWELVAGRPVDEVPVPAGRAAVGEMTRTAVSPDARAAVVAWWHGSLTTWDAEHPRVLAEVPDPLRQVTTLAVAVSPTGPIALSGGEGLPPRVWDPLTGRCVRTLDAAEIGPVPWIRAAAVSADGSLAVMGGHGDTVWVQPMPMLGYRAPWSYARPRDATEVARTTKAFEEAMAVGRRLIDEGRYEEAAAHLRTTRSMPGFGRDPGLRAAWRAVGRHGRRSGMLGITKGYQYDGERFFTQPVTLALTADGSLMATGRWFGPVDLWDVDSGEHVPAFRVDESHAQSIGFVQQDRTLVVLDVLGRLHVFDLREGDRRFRITGVERSRITAVAIPLDGGCLVTGDEQGVLGWQDLEAGTCLRAVQAHGGAVRDVALSLDGRYAASHGTTRPEANRSGGPFDENSEIRLWDLGSGTCAWILHARRSPTRLRFSPDGRLLFVLDGFEVAAFDVVSGRKRYTVDGGQEMLLALAADGSIGVTPTHDGALQVWQLSTGRILRTIGLSEYELFQSLVLTDDGRFAIVGGTSHTVRVLDLWTGDCLRTLEGLPGPASSLALGADGTRLVIADLASVVSVWELEWDFDFSPRPEGDDPDDAAPRSAGRGRRWTRRFRRS